MRVIHFLKSSLLLGAVICGHPSVAREATILDFGEQGRSVSMAGKTGSIPPAVVTANSDDHSFAQAPPFGAGVSDLMLLEFGRPAAPPAITVPPLGSALLPTDQLSIPAWMKPRMRSFRMPLDREAIFASGLAGGRYDRCDSMSYSPAWWLDPRTAARRIEHFATIASVACEYGVPTALLDAVVAQESGYKSWAISPKGAMGMMQIMPGTANELGLVAPFDPTANLRAGARYLRMQLDRFGRVELALAAYNAGPHRRSLKEGRVPPFAETRNYVRTIMTNWGRLAPRAVEISTVDRGAVAAAAVAASPLRTATLVRFDGLVAVQSF